jgi:hypothetical protein
MNERKKKKKRRCEGKKKKCIPPFTFSFFDGLLLFFVFYVPHISFLVSPIKVSFLFPFSIISYAFFNFLPLKRNENRDGSKQ